MGTLNHETRRQLIERVNADSSLWRTEAWAAYAQVSDELESIRCWNSEDQPSEARLCEIAIVQADLDAALLAMCPPSRDALSPGARLWVRLKMYYSGAEVERTWSAIHRASASLYMLYHASELLAQATRLHELVSALPNLSSQASALAATVESLKKGSAGPKLKKRAALREFYREAMGASDSLQVGARFLRNELLMASGALSLVMLALGIAHFADSSIFPLCATSEGKEVCLTGSSSHRLDLIVVALAGMLGGALSIVIPIATGERIKTPYRVFAHQLLLKMVTGSATGVAGVMLVESKVISGLTLTSSAAIIGYAVFFGFAQQAITGIVDRRASSLAKETPTAKIV